MDQLKQNKEFIIRCYNALSGHEKTRELMCQYIEDEELIDHGAFFDTILPKYEIYADEMVAEGNKIVVKARMKGIHAGEFKGVKPTFRAIEFSFAIKYEIENEKIVNHWIIGDQVALMEQLGFSNVTF